MSKSISPFWITFSPSEFSFEGLQHASPHSPHPHWLHLLLLSSLPSLPQPPAGGWEASSDVSLGPLFGTISPSSLQQSFQVSSQILSYQWAFPLLPSLKQRSTQYPLTQQFSTFLAVETRSVKDNVSTDRGWEVVQVVTGATGRGRRNLSPSSTTHPCGVAWLLTGQGR